MNLKRWSLWLCLALLVVGEVMLFKAKQQRDVALVGQRQAQHDADQARKDLEEIKAAAAAAAQGGESDRLRQENARLSQAITALKSETNRLQQASQKLTQQLSAAGETAQQQQARLQQWEAASQQARTEARTAAQQSQSRAVMDRNACIANLKLMDTAKLQWALQYNKTENDIPTAQDLTPYFTDRVFPVCPSGGTYTINSVGQTPTCSIPGHALPP
jgi:hypothetical protein